MNLWEVVEFVVPDHPPGIYEVVYIDVQKVEEAWQNNHQQYVGPGGQFSEDAEGFVNRYERFMAFLHESVEAGGQIEVPTMSLVGNALPSFIYGRHRFAAIRDLGHQVLPVMIPTIVADECRSRFGSP